MPLLAPVVDRGVTGFRAGFRPPASAWVDVLPKFQEMSDPEADASENEDVPDEPAVVIESCCRLIDVFSDFGSGESNFHGISG